LRTMYYAEGVPLHSPGLSAPGGLPWVWPSFIHLPCKGCTSSGALFNPFRVSAFLLFPTQGSPASRTTLGYGVQLLRSIFRDGTQLLDGFLDLPKSMGYIVM